MHVLLSSHELIKNLKSGFTVSLVGIPLSVSLAVVSGVSPTTGIITAIWAGLVAALFGGSNYNIVGPTGALSGLITSYALLNGPQAVSMLAVMTGIFILCAYLLRIERYLVFIPSSVIHGFTLGVACIIGFSQLGALTTIDSVMIFILFFGAIIFLRKLMPSIPGAIILSPIGILVGYLADAGMVPLRLVTLGNKFGAIPAKIMQMPSYTIVTPIIIPALVIALVALLETMLSAKIADTLTHTKYKPRKEMLGLGLANIVSGLMGGMPATAALARTAFNIRAGASSRVSAFFSSICIALSAILFLSAFTFIPMAVIAALLVHIAINMVDHHHFVQFYTHDKASLTVALLVAAITVYEDPIIGILVGCVVALLLFAEKISHGRYTTSLHTYEKPNDVLLYAISGKCVYLNSFAHITRFQEGFKEYRGIILRLDMMHFIDLDGIEALDEIIDIVRQRGQKMVIAGLEPYLIPLLRGSSKEFKRLEKEGLVFETVSDGLVYFK